MTKEGGLLSRIRGRTGSNGKQEPLPTLPNNNIGAAFQDINFEPPHCSFGTGVLSLLTSNDYVSPSFHTELKQKSPDGYIVGVGAGAIFSLVNSFDKEKPPRGIVIADINPKVVWFSKFLIDKMSESESFEVFCRNFFDLGDEEYLKQMRARLKMDSDGRLVKELEKQGLAIRTTPRNLWQSYTKRRENPPSSDIKVIEPIDALKENYELLHSLAKAGSITAVYTDITNPDFIEAAGQLPDFESGTNVIYLSNASVFLNTVVGSSNVISRFNGLGAFETPDRNTVFVDSVTAGNFTLMVHDSFSSLAPGLHDVA